MKKVKIIEVYVDETLKDAEECVGEVVKNAHWHEYIDDGSVKLVVKDVENN